MVKWEYQEGHYKASEVGFILAEEGQQGWEAYHIRQGTDFHTRVYFKRPIEEEPEYRETNIFPEPDRVVINESGEAVHPIRAQAAGVYMGAIFIRKDGWSLGAHPSLMDVAESLWPDEWLVVIHKTTIMSYETYKQQRAKGFIP